MKKTCLLKKFVHKSVSVLLMVVMIFGLVGCGNTRKKLESGISYRNDCIIDELNWFSDKESTATHLKEFYDLTGVQPYILIKEYDSSLKTDSQKDTWACNYYDNNFDAENIFLFVFFTDQNPTKNGGYMTYVNGYDTETVMDDEAVKIFWNKIDKYWYSNMQIDMAFEKAFLETAEKIMK